MPHPTPHAAVRTQVTIPLRLSGGDIVSARVITFDGLVDGREHVAIGLGPGSETPRRNGGSRPPLVRLHSECLTGDVLGSRRCDCGPQLDEALVRIDDTGGYLLYLRQEGRGIGLYAKLDAYLLQDSGMDTYEANLALGYAADERDYTAAAQMLLALGVPSVRLLSNNPDKARQLEGHGIVVTEEVTTEVHLNASNARYLATKARHGAHLVLPRRASGAAVAGQGPEVRQDPAPRVAQR